MGSCCCIQRICQTASCLRYATFVQADYLDGCSSYPRVLHVLSLSLAAAQQPQGSSRRSTGASECSTAVRCSAVDCDSWWLARRRHLLSGLNLLQRQCIAMQVTCTPTHQGTAAA
jgi:hypothetical protein